MTLDSFPDLEYKRVVSCKDSSHGTDVLAVSEHGAWSSLFARAPSFDRRPQGRPEHTLGHDPHAVFARLPGLDRLGVRVGDDEQVESLRHRAADLQASFGRELLGELACDSLPSEPTEQLA